MPPPDPVIAAALARAAGALPNHEDRPEQLAMAEAVGRAIKQHRHLVVQAGTGTGKSLAYLVPALALGARVVVSTATKALQDQLAHRDLPLLARSSGLRFEFAVLKGRSNYICRQRVNEISGGGQQLALGDEDKVGRGGLGPLGREVRRLVTWAEGGPPGPRLRQGPQAGAISGDRAELPWEPSEAAWAQVSTGWRECPGAAQCPAGGQCYAEAARRRAGEADVVVVNTHLYATSLALKEADLLPPHDLVVFDEAHELEDIASVALGFDMSHGRLVGLARLARPLVADSAAVAALEEAALRLARALQPYRDQAVPRPLDDELSGALSVVRERASTLLEALRKAGRHPGSSSSGAGTGAAAAGAAAAGAGAGAADGPGSAAQAARQRAQKAASHLVDDANAVLELRQSQLAWVEGTEHLPVLRVAPLDVGAALVERLWQGEEAPTAVLTSATIPPHLGERLGLAPGAFDQLDVGSPFAYAEQALLYCPLHLPDPRAANFEAAMHEELVALIEAAQGRTLALFTSWRAMESAAEAVRQRVTWRVLTQSDLPKPKLVDEFSADEHSCLFATMGFWQGVDVPGPSLSLVTIDRLPFPRPDDPLLKARRAALGRRAFELIDVPRAATLLAQGVGRLVRSREDRGVVAVLDRRLGKARYRWELVSSLPPMRRTRSRADVEAFLAPLRH